MHEHVARMRLFIYFTTIFVDTRLWKTKHLRKRFQSFRQSSVLLTDRIEIHRSQPLVWPSDLLYVMIAGCDWWISIWSVNNTKDWRKFWKRFCGSFVFQSRVSTKTVVIVEFMSSREEWNDVKYIWNNSLLYCRCRWKWRKWSRWKWSRWKWNNVKYIWN